MEPLSFLVVWKEDNSDMSCSGIRQHLTPQRCVGSTQLWSILSFGSVLYWPDFQAAFMLMNTFLVLFSQFRVSLLVPPSWLIMLPR